MTKIPAYLEKLLIPVAGYSKHFTVIKKITSFQRTNGFWFFQFCTTEILGFVLTEDHLCTVKFWVCLVFFQPSISVDTTDVEE